MSVHTAMVLVNLPFAMFLHFVVWRMANDFDVKFHGGRDQMPFWYFGGFWLFMWTFASIFIFSKGCQ